MKRTNPYESLFYTAMMRTKALSLLIPLGKGGTRGGQLEEMVLVALADSCSRAVSPNLLCNDKRGADVPWAI